MNIEDIAKCILFKDVSHEDLHQILLAVDAKETAFSKGEVLARQDETCNRLIIIIKGSVMTEMEGPSGKIVKVEDLYAPTPLAILFLFGRENRFPVNVITREKGAALVISKSAVLKLLQMNEAILKNYLDISAYYASALSKKLYLFSFRTIRQKIASYILSLAKGDATIIETEHNQSSLALYFGVSRPSLARELRNMQDDGLILVRKKEIEILDKSKLIQLVNFS